MEAGGFEAMEVTEAGLREGVFYETLLDGMDPPLVEDVRARVGAATSPAPYGADFAHVEHVARLALELWDALGRAELHECDPLERDLLWSAAMLHDIGTAVDYDDHHKHSRYLILNAGLPGFTPRETGLIGQLARYHRKGSPGLGEFSALARAGDEALRGALLGRPAPRRAARAPARPDRPGRLGGRRGRHRRAAPRALRGRHGGPVGRRASARRVPAGIRARAADP